MAASYVEDGDTIFLGPGTTIEILASYLGGKKIRAEVPLAEMFGYSTDLRSATQGRATYSMEFKKYSEAPAHVAAQVTEARKG